MAGAHPRAFTRILVAVVTSGLVGEAAFVAFVLRTGAWGATTWDRLLGEIALAGFVYGSLSGVVIFAHARPDIAFRTFIYRTEARQRRNARFVFAIAIILFVVPSLMELAFLMTGLSTTLQTAQSLLHLYPIAGGFVAVSFTVGSPLARTPIPDAR